MIVSDATMKTRKPQAKQEPIDPANISPELLVKCAGPGQFERFDSLVGRLLSISPKRADEIRGFASVNPNPRGRPRKDSGHGASSPI